jgi:hypothetical protein
MYITCMQGEQIIFMVSARQESHIAVIYLKSLINP